MDYLKRGLHLTLESVKKHKLLFGVILLLQIILVVSSLALGAQYLIKILENTQGIIGPLEKANYDSQKIQEGEALVPDYAGIYQNYQSMLKNVLWFCTWIAALFLLLNGSIWTLSQEMLKEEKPKSWKARIKENVQSLAKIWTSMLLLVAPFTLASCYILLHFIRVSQSFSDIALVLKILLAAWLGAYYFLVVALGVSSGSSWKEFATGWLRLSVKEFGKSILLFCGIMLVLLASLAVLYAAIEYEESLALLLLSGLLCIATITITRIFWIAALSQIDDKEKT